MSTFSLKLFACIVMLIDHIGAVFLPEFIGLRIIGRLAFPIFAFFIVEGYYKTSNVRKYATRLSLFAIISQLPFMMAFNNGMEYLNVFFTLAIGLISIIILDHKLIKDIKLAKIIIIIVTFAIVENKYYTTDYGIYGIVVILLFKAFRNDFKKLVIALIGANTIYILSIALYMIDMSIPLNSTMFLQGASLLALIFIYKYNGKQNRKLKWFFYWFYPIHLLILSVIKYLIYI